MCLLIFLDSVGYTPSYIVTELVVEQNTISSAGEYNGGGGLPSGSMTPLCKMEKGDHALIRTTGVRDTHAVYSKDNYPQSSFLGLLINSMSYHGQTINVNTTIKCFCFCFLLFYCLILSVNKYHLGPGFQVMKSHKKFNLIYNLTLF